LVAGVCPFVQDLVFQEAGKLLVCTSAATPTRVVLIINPSYFSLVAFVRRAYLLVR